MIYLKNRLQQIRNISQSGDGKKRMRKQMCIIDSNKIEEYRKMLKQKDKNHRVPTFGHISSKSRIDTEISSGSLLKQKINCKKTSHPHHLLIPQLQKQTYYSQSNNDLLEPASDFQSNRQKLFRNSFIKNKVVKENAYKSSQRCKTSYNQNNSPQEQLINNRRAINSERQKAKRTIPINFMNKTAQSKFLTRKQFQKSEKIRKSLPEAPYKRINWEQSLRQWTKGDIRLNDFYSNKEKIRKIPLRAKQKMQEINEWQRCNRIKLLFNGIRGKKAPINETTDYFRHKYSNGKMIQNFSGIKTY